MPRRYQVVFRGESEVLARAFPDLTPRFEAGNTTLAGALLDQSQLMGLLLRADSLGCELMSLNVVEPDESVRTQP